MTQADIMTALSKTQPTVHEAILKVSERIPSIKEKLREGKLHFNSQFSIEECIEIFKELNANEIQLILLKENFKEKYTDIYEITGTHKFLDEYKRNPDIKCCNTCKYLVGFTGTHKMPQPYCKAYNKYLSSFNAKVYEDWCSSYIKARLPKPRQWFKETAPVNLNRFGETDTVNGIEISKMMNSERSVKGVVTRVNQVGFDQ